MRRTIALLVAANFASALHGGDFDGRLCLMQLPKATCVSTTTGAVAVAAAPAARPFVWTDLAGRDAIVGALPASMDRIDLSLVAPLVAFRLTSDSANWPAAVDVELRNEDGPAVWKWSWSRRMAAGLHSIRLPAGKYELAIRTPHHRQLKCAFEAKSGRADLGSLSLESANRLTATVVDRDSKMPIAGATLTDMTGAVLATADALGRVDADLAEPRPATIEIRADGHGTRVLELPKARADAELGRIALAPGGSIHVAIEGGPDECSLELRTDAQLIAERSLGRDRRETRFDGLEAREDYLLAVRGRGPLQQFAKSVGVAEGKTTALTLVVVPHNLKVTTYLGENRLPRASVNFTQAETRWQGALATDDNGEAAVELWQPGRFMVWFKSAELPVPYATFIETPDTTEIDLPLRLPDLRITGRVVDSETGFGIDGGEVILESAREDGSNSSLGATADRSGRFEYRAVAPGHQKLTATATGYVGAAPVEFDLSESDAGRDVTIRLARGVPRRVEVVSPAGIGIAGANVAECASGRLVRLHETDGSGSATVSIPVGESRTLYAVPREGSFAVAHIESVRADSGTPDTVRVAVPPAVGSLRVVTRTPKNVPIANVMLLLRYNMETVPFEVLQILGRVQGLTFMTSASGEAMWRQLPAGRYELWPATDRREVDAIFASIGPPPPVALDLRGGENEAVLTFTPAQELRSPGR